MSDVELLEKMNETLDLSAEELRNYAYDMICRGLFENDGDKSNDE